MKRATDDMPTPSPQRRGRRSVGSAALAVIGCAALLLGACGGDDDDAEGDSSTTTTTAESGATTTVASPTTTAASATTTTEAAPLDLVTEGATVAVANASGINGAAGRMTDSLADVGFTTGDPTNSTEGPLETTKVYYDPANEQAQPVADSVREALGGGDIEVLEMPAPPPTDTGEIGDATVLVAMGNDTADKPLDELQGSAAPAADTADDESTAESTGESTEESSSEPSGDDTTTNESDEQSSDG